MLGAMSDAPAPPPLPQPNWWTRNWKWAAPGGCLFVLLMGLGFAAGIFFLITGMMKQSDAYKIAWRERKRIRRSSQRSGGGQSAKGCSLRAARM